MRYFILTSILFFSTLYAEFPIECIGTTEITFIDSKKQKAHVLTCFNPLEIDFDKHYLQSLNPDPAPKQQVHFKDDDYDLFADNLTANYRLDKGQFEIDDLKLFGNVFLIQKEIGSHNEIEKHYILADQLDYHGQNKPVLLKSNENSKVLYYDELNQYQIAANEVVIKKNPQNDKFAVEGIGTVHLTFKEEELQKFKSRLLNSQKGLSP